MTKNGKPQKSRRRKKRSLAPKEHGAYAQVSIPLVVGILLAGSTLVALFWSLLVVAAFLAHEPVLVLLGQRGKRARRQLADRATSRLVLLGTVGAAAAGLAWWSASWPGRYAMLLVIGVALPLAGFMLAEKEKTAPGELWAAAVFASSLVPVAVAGGLDWRAAWTAVIILFAIFGLGTLSVRAVIGHLKKGRIALWPPTVGVFVVLLTAGLASAWGLTDWLTAAAVLPTSLLVIGILIRTPHPRHLRTLGFSLLGASILGALILLTGLWPL